MQHWGSEFTSSNILLPKYIIFLLYNF